jgi:8-hydroxy-5-deazaflavin:NADPH oxidoreductase
MKVGIVGSGDVGQSLGSAFIKLGHPVRLGSRNSKNPATHAWVSRTGAPATAGSFAEAAEFGELVVIATRGMAALEAIQLAGPSHFQDKDVIDVTNPLVFQEGSPPALGVGFTDSMGEQIQRAVPRAHVVKAFNTVGHAHFFRPHFPGGPPDMFYCGEDPNAKGRVGELIREFGWNPIDIGGIAGARVLEPVCLLWVSAAMSLGSWDIAFKLLRK